MILNSDEPSIPDAFLLQVKQVLENFFDFPYLNRHPLARQIGLPRARSSETDGQRLRRFFLAGIEALRPDDAAGERTLQGRDYRLLRLRYVDSNTMQEAARLLGLSERQAYRDLKRAEQSLAGLLWLEMGGATAGGVAELENAAGQEDGAKELPEVKELSGSAQPPAEIEAAEAAEAVDELQGLNLKMMIVDVKDLLRNVLKAVERLAAERAVTLEVRLPEAADEPDGAAEPAGGQIHTDPSLAQQVLISLLSSLVQAAATQRVTIDTQALPAGLRLCFSFRQTGHQPFQPPHSGLIHMLLDRLSWQMALDQQAETGLSMLSLTVPVQESTLLVIDDNNALIELLRRYLTQTRCQVVGADNGLQGLQLAQSLHPHAILLDVMMPNIDGWEVLQRLQLNSETSHIPVIICSIFNDPELARSLGAAHTLGKPVKRAELLELLSRLRLV